MSASATEAQVITAQPLFNSTDAQNISEGFSQFNPTNNTCDPEQQEQVKEQRRHETTVWCCIGCDEFCDCAECCADCCADIDTPVNDNDGSGCADCFDCCADGTDCCSD